MPWNIYKIKAKVDWMLINSNEIVCIKHWVAIDSILFEKCMCKSVTDLQNLQTLIFLKLSIGIQQNCSMELFESVSAYLPLQLLYWIVFY